MKTKIATVNNFEKEILNSTKACVVLFSSEFCHLCVMLKPVFEKLAEEYNNIKFFTVDTLEEERLTKIFSDSGVPTIYFFVKGDATEIEYPSDEDTGYSEESLRTFFNAHESGNLRIVKGEE
jgi:thioredoxin 1|tara:strand:- start:96 stop:461 length:366 start_codon:yes stop_codon:yes gene_type:complete